MTGVRTCALPIYLRISSSGQEEKLAKNQELESIRVSQAISFLPELQCASKNILKENCFDKYKLEAFATLEDKDNLYYPFFYYSEITVEEIYPYTGKWILYNRTRNGTFYVTSIPILIYNATTKLNAFGVLDVKYYPIE